MVNAIPLKNQMNTITRFLQNQLPTLKSKNKFKIVSTKYKNRLINDFHFKKIPTNNRSKLNLIRKINCFSQAIYF